MDLTDPDDYRRFLSMQLMARAPIEAWLALNLPSNGLPGAPPPLAALIVKDLEELGAPLPRLDIAFALPADTDPIGACWAIAGSSMGNRSMLHHLTKSGKGGSVPTAFLADGAMTGYWQTLRPRLEAPAGDSTKTEAAALAVFATFTAAAEACLADRPAA